MKYDPRLVVRADDRLLLEIGNCHTVLTPKDRAILCAVLREGYLYVRKMHDGQWIALRPMMMTVGLCLNLDPYGYASRYCYAFHEDALTAIGTWTGYGDPPGPWIKHKGTHNGQHVDRSNPDPEPRPELVDRIYHGRMTAHMLRFER